MLFLELALFLASKANLLRIDLPSYSIANAKPFWADIDPAFGVWHPANSQYRHVKSCFDVTYASNAHGMRDRARDLTADQPRVVVLGDSFVEGYGVADRERLTDRLEAQTGIAHLNFGTSGNFGVTQSWLLYKTLASRFEHDAVILSVLPDNDFADDDFANAKTVFGDRYRPYLVGSYPDYRLTYHNETMAKARLREFGQAFEAALSEFTYTAKAYSYFKAYFKAPKPVGPADGAALPAPSLYFDFTEAQFDRLRYGIEQIAALAAPRPVLVVTIARRSDYRRAAREQRVPPLVERLSALSARLNIQYVDLLGGLKADARLDGLFHACDPHWNAEGNAAAAEVIGRWDFLDRSARTVAQRAEFSPPF
ncbi:MULTISPECIES: SGNH/GDSL hydrolase family protein [Rhodomicrobium]|uniref:SGNH/GDSL hydrolase family protein n=1 Tax=Rhodomicrobium TaxID=1068 RepID=UPI000B4B988B|nr:MULTISPECIES: SGNH/GDSL hydrolase family protein [Rhodomicrobium]